ncbi:hypothetical protein SPRG_04861 [Saprolegnia parasitica CBS 223.65]|uniref:Uncharacterized protein n=1 Tax=Saprolegnia parasitica (strain CBS 223.65) TaxID=695850 RepID=A0A067CG88_SAPPC|nr:hypothetical protein SPRG_04861 [Saprolegnia parasitica CBS 223.65]KDO29744.1 hypothetical protein SPRG_04861 [Saprolegnia parasitica CBS 223.65]|eukprot:XP_012199392.1 hypothetical protein SPRG_04861 [Saprolegnia parasitica CBS 223.65]
MESVNIGNYKGVMLCNRPFNSVSSSTLVATSILAHASLLAQKEVAAVDKKGPFLGGIQPAPIGTNVPIFHEPPHAVKRDKKSTALSKHKKWLHDLQKERSRLESALLEDEAAKECRKDKFAKREADLRAKIRQRPQGTHSKYTEMARARVDDEEKGVLTSRPAWALTKDKAESKRDQQDEDSVDDLLAFANNLDIDTFLGDVELKAQVAQVDEQLAQLQELVNQEEADEKKGQVRERLQQESLERQYLNAATLARLSARDAKDSDDDDDSKSVASTVLSECKSIRSVHSTKSVLALTKRAEQKLSLDPIPEPHVVTHDEESGTRLLNKHLTSNLPYMHRNPAV